MPVRPMMTKGGCTGKHGRRSGSALSEGLGRTRGGAPAAAAKNNWLGSLQFTEVFGEYLGSAGFVRPHMNCRAKRLGDPKKDQAIACAIPADRQSAKRKPCPSLHRRCFTNDVINGPAHPLPVGSIGDGMQFPDVLKCLNLASVRPRHRRPVRGRQGCTEVALRFENKRLGEIERHWFVRPNVRVNPDCGGRRCKARQRRWYTLALPGLTAPAVAGQG